MSDPFYTFIAWVKLDARMVQHQAFLSKLSQTIEAIDVQAHSLKHEQELARREVVHAKKQVDQQELAIRTLRDREKTITAQRDTSNSSKEYVSLDAQLKIVSAELNQHEDKLFELFEVYEEMQKRYAEQEFAYNTQQAELSRRKSSGQQALQQHRESLDVLEPEYEALKNQVNEEFAKLFAERKKLVANPVVPVSTGSCSACSYMIIAQDMVRLRKRQLVPCQQCYRLLYMDEGI